MSTQPSADRSLTSRAYRGARSIAGPLIVVDAASDLPFGAMVTVACESGPERTGQVIDVSEDRAVIQVLEDTGGLDLPSARIRLEEREALLPVSDDMIGRTFDGKGRPADGLPAPVPESFVPISGAPINPISRARPDDVIETGISSIDGFNSLLRGQKLPIFSGAGLPGNEIAASILANARSRREGAGFLVVFAAIGMTHRELSFFTASLEACGARDRAILFANAAADPTIERILTPRYALAAAEHFAFEKGRDVLVILTDMTAYCEALRELGSAREEIPGRRGYPGYMYTDLASLFERAGRLRGRPGSVTLIPILTMPDDDLTHPIPDLTGYITEGQVFLSRQLHRKGVFPPVDILRSLSRLMNNGTGPGKTRDDHRGVANQLYACYAEGQDIRRLTAIIGEDALGDLDRRYLRFADRFEREIIGQGRGRRAIEETLDAGWRLLGSIPAAELRRLSKELISRYYSPIMEDGVPAPK